MYTRRSAGSWKREEIRVKGMVSECKIVQQRYGVRRMAGRGGRGGKKTAAARAKVVKGTKGITGITGMSVRA